MPNRSLVVAVLAVVVAGCSVDLPVASTGPSGVPPSATQATFDPNRVLTATSDGLTLTAQLDRWQVESSGRISAHVTVRNDRPDPVWYLDAPCLLVPSWTVKLAVPVDPRGRGWDGIAGRFKNFALTRGMGPGGVPALNPIDSMSTDRLCEGLQPRKLLQPAQSVEWTLHWAAELVAGLPALPGTAAFTISLTYLPQAALQGRICCKSLAVAGQLEVTGGVPRIVSAGEAIDAMLRLPRFAAWLPQQPASTWSALNIFLQSYPKAEGIIPAGQFWEIDLFRELGVQRNWAIGFVDARTGVVKSITFCDIPCDR